MREHGLKQIVSKSMKGLSVKSLNCELLFDN